MLQNQIGQYHVLGAQTVGEDDRVPFVGDAVKQGFTVDFLPLFLGMLTAAVVKK